MIDFRRAARSVDARSVAPRRAPHPLLCRHGHWTSRTLLAARIGVDQNTSRVALHQVPGRTDNGVVGRRPRCSGALDKAGTAEPSHSHRGPRKQKRSRIPARGEPREGAPLCFAAVETDQAELAGAASLGSGCLAPAPLLVTLRATAEVHQPPGSALADWRCRSRVRLQQRDARRRGRRLTCRCYPGWLRWPVVALPSGAVTRRYCPSTPEYGDSPGRGGPGSVPGVPQAAAGRVGR